MIFFWILHWEDPEEWDGEGEGGGKGDRDGEHM